VAKKVSTTVYLTPEQLDALKALSERTRVPIAEYIREGVEMVLERHGSKLPGQLDLGFSDA
jgi:predicted DNA-binding protein